jgi:pSer/pThr/pTyr-binding forkhead associated (FHA) protein
MEFVAFAAGLLLVGIGVRAGMSRVAKWRRLRRRGKHRNIPLPHLIIPTSPGAADILPAGVDRDLPQVAAKPATAQQAPDREVPLNEPPPPKRPAKKRPRKERPEIERERDLERWMEPSARRDASAGESPDATVAFKRPPNEAVQVLPGRLHVLSGEAAGKELRLFSRVGERPRIVVGREAGPRHRHITLRSPTVSRRHARMEFIDGQWTITNLSATNPVLVNDRALTDPSSVKTLANGDRIELGEVALRFLAS